MNREPIVVYGLYLTPEAADRAFQGLRDAGLDERQLAVLSSEPFPGHEFARREGRSAMPWLAALGGLVGGLSGYLLAAWTQQAYPIPTGGMPLAPLWTDGIITYELAMLGAIVATVLTLLTSARLPDWSARLHDPEIALGKILIGVVNAPETAAGGRAEIERRLLDAGAPQVKQYPP